MTLTKIVGDRNKYSLHARAMYRIFSVEYTDCVSLFPVTGATSRAEEV